MHVLRPTSRHGSPTFVSRKATTSRPKATANRPTTKPQPTNQQPTNRPKSSKVISQLTLADLAYFSRKQLTHFIGTYDRYDGCRYMYSLITHAQGKHHVLDVHTGISHVRGYKGQHPSYPSYLSEDRFWEDVAKMNADIFDSCRPVAREHFRNCQQSTQSQRWAARFPSWCPRPPPPAGAVRVAVGCEVVDAGMQADIRRGPRAPRDRRACCTRSCCGCATWCSMLIHRRSKIRPQRMLDYITSTR